MTTTASAQPQQPPFSSTPGAGLSSSSPAQPTAKEDDPPLPVAMGIFLAAILMLLGFIGWALRGCLALDALGREVPDGHYGFLTLNGVWWMIEVFPTRGIPLHSLFSLPYNSRLAQFVDYVGPLVLTHLLAAYFSPTSPLASYSLYLTAVVALVSLVNLSSPPSSRAGTPAAGEAQCETGTTTLTQEKSGCREASGKECNCAEEIEDLKKQLAEKERVL
ncbi:hypothetical protein JCM8547_001298 [Rhodosporidiobolus lusitaniae]